MAKNSDYFASLGSNGTVMMIAYLLLAVIIFIIDRVSKWMIVHSAVTDYSVTSWLSWTLQYNRGVSWSFLHAEDSWLFVLVSLGVLIVTGLVLLHAYMQLRKGRIIFGQVMVIAGSCSNLLDRLLFGGVVDFIHLHINDWSFAIFNVADAAIVLGVCSMFVQEIYYQDR